MAQHGLSCPRLQSLLRPDPPAWRTPSSLASQLTLAGLCPCGAVRLAFPSLLCHALCVHAATPTPPTGRFRLMVHPPVIRAFVHSVETRLFRICLSLVSERSHFRGGSFLVMLRPARWLARLTSPRRTLSRIRQARTFTAELAPAGVSPRQSLLSLLGPTTYCRGGICTRSHVKDRRLHTESWPDRIMGKGNENDGGITAVKCLKLCVLSAKPRPASPIFNHTPPPPRGREGRVLRASWRRRILWS